MPPGLTSRKIEILDEVVRFYIRSAVPASSFNICERLSTAVSSATVRNEMMALERDGYLYRPHISSGCVPTALGIRTIINPLLKQYNQRVSEKSDPNIFLKISAKTRMLAQSTESVVFVMSGRNIHLSGLEFIFSAPEFSEIDIKTSFAKMLDVFYSQERRLEGLFKKPLEVFIAEDNPFVKSGSFSVIGRRFSNKEILAFVGFLRMNYERAISELIRF